METENHVHRWKKNGYSKNVGCGKGVVVCCVMIAYLVKSLEHYYYIMSDYFKYKFNQWQVRSYAHMVDNQQGSYQKILLEI